MLEAKDQFKLGDLICESYDSSKPPVKKNL